MTSHERVPIMLDVDTGLDDALALALAIELPGVDLLAVSTLAGNVDVLTATQNTLNVLDFLGAADIPVYQGASRPLIRAHRGARHVHGDDGIGGADLPMSSLAIGQYRGPAAMVRLAMERPGEVTLVCIGPLTNLAIALNVQPDLPRLLAGLVIMGGAYHRNGNITPHAEFNIWADPEAAAQVFAATFPRFIAVGLDVSEQVALDVETWREIGRASLAPRAAQLTARVGRLPFAEQASTGMHLHDPLAVAVALDPSLVGMELSEIDVRVAGDAEGRTDVIGPGTVEVARTVDAERFLQLFHDTLSLPSPSGKRQ